MAIAVTIEATVSRSPAEVFAQIAERAGRLFWLNPEPKLYWNYGDSVMSAYEPFCDGVFECWTTKQLEGFVSSKVQGVGGSCFHGIPAPRTMYSAESAQV